MDLHFKQFYVSLICVLCSELILSPCNLNMDSNNNDSRSLRIVSWNMRGIRGSYPYINHLLSNNDICVLSEHHLFECQLHRLSCINNDFDVYSKSARKLDNRETYSQKGHGGIAIMWRKCLSNDVQKCINLGDDRIGVIKLSNQGGFPIFIIGVYLPQRACVISDFDDYVYHLEIYRGTM